MAHLYRLIVALLLAFTSLSASASFPATVRPAGYGVTYFPGVWLGETKAATCTAWKPCATVFADQSGCNGACAAAGYPAFISVGASYFCPANSTLSGTSCTCTTGYTESGNTCIPIVIPPSAQELTCALVSGQYVPENPITVEIGSVSTSTLITAVKNSSLKFCDSTGCSASGRAISGGIFGTVSFVTLADAKYDGTPCNTTTPAGPSTAQEAAKLCKSGTCPGSVNGIEGCYPCQTSVDSKSAVESSTSSGTGTTATGTVTQQTTVCQDGKCTTTTEVTKSTTDGSGTTSTTGTSTTKNETTSDFCAKNPTVAICKTATDGTFNGSCGSQPTCTGDAVMCAVAAAAFKTACALDPGGTSAEKAVYDAKKGLTGNRITDLPGNETVGISSASFSSAAVLGAGSCITDRVVTVMKSTITLPFSTICPWLGHLKTILIGISYLMALTIVFRKTT